MIPRDTGENVHSIVDRLRVVFPERQIVMRHNGAVRCLRFSCRFQIGVLLLCLAIGGWVSYATYAVFNHGSELAAKDAQIASVRMAYRSLLGDVAEYQKRFTGIVRDLEENHTLMLALAGRRPGSASNSFKGVAGGIDTPLGGKAKADVERKRKQLRSQMGDIETKMKILAKKNFSLKDDLSSVETDLQTALSERNSALLRSTQMRHDIQLLEHQLTVFEQNENDSVDRLTEQTAEYISTMERVVEKTGLDVDQLLAANEKENAGQGGPFVEIKPSNRPAGRLKTKLALLDDKLNQSDLLQSILGRIPLSPPLKTYTITSRFGPRRDPVNHRLSMHYGLDMGAYRRTPVYVMAPGVVVYAGWRGNFGNMVEVDHGDGIRTRYGHLNKILVKKGAKVSYKEKIGLVGSTGRSTGPHLHYEVLYKNKSMDPLKFIMAGRDVFQE
ncbi:M23 family metallopeptidase [Varunaivibrio sulfuroxidans]|uniref:Murein DD-endopeptidase MepM/ murein hydrolase activator NlpD n=1 Tax=Varunaivibrio sulfuroxidans TaxID=1773489 RepID=A0A4R3JDS2_9PROT|nr:M23 family metallopeptidase [Varunaivibrio sulfuroxidans]TCS64209.1 murein DD-endopeptidase MepM/ murein hydrolase activator NlpD [Varunaivibrio sulfuroxidans]WES31348.1 peptidoglycan DD-metalloendopeptidase family protein [Varunaivibrio sulfuroxidans]